MSTNTKIEWADATLNVVTGCTRVSPGCDHCYIERTPPFRMNGRRFDKPGIGGTTGVTLHPDRLELPLRWRKPRRIFVNALADLFHDDVPDEFIARMWAVMAATPQHTYQILTKRHGRMRSLLSRGTVGTPGFFDDVEEAMAEFTHAEPVGWPLPNVWLGCSVEDQKRADLRIPALLDTPAAVRFLSCEPLIGPVSLHRYLREGWPTRHITQQFPAEQGRHSRDVGVGWVIAGGESGPGARPMHPDWARSLRDQCQAASVKFLFKQWGEFIPNPSMMEQDHGYPCVTVPHQGDDLLDSQMWRVGKKAAGRELDGRVWDEFPAAAS